jgi:prolyl-tRNA synthetase
MRYSKLFGKTLRETPKNVSSTSQQLLLRAGFIKSSGHGVFLLLPLAWRILQNVDRILSAQAAARGVQFLEAPPPAPSAPKEGAASAEVKRALSACRPQIRQQYPMAAQHEDDLSMLAGALPMTYKELPFSLGISRWQYREESRGAATLASARQFPVHAAYSFDAEEESAQNSRLQLLAVCQAAFSEMGVRAVALETGVSHSLPVSTEFVVLSDAGDEEVIQCSGCEYFAGLERAQSVFPEFRQDEVPRLVEAVFGPGIIGTAELAAFVGIPVQKTTKALLFQADDSVVAVCVRGEYDVSETKLAALLGCSTLKLAPAGVVKELTGAEVGYAGPIGLPEEVRTVWDLTTEGRVNFEAGANRTDYHLINVNFDRDLPKPQEFVDVRKIREGETCARCRRGRLEMRRGTRIGHVSQLGTMYSKELKAAYASRGGRSEPMHLSCYGIDTHRLLAAIVEQNSDKKGILWPSQIAPFQAHLISLPGVESRARDLYGRLRHEGIDVLWDDRETPSGAKFADADLIGMPIRLVISTRTGNNVEWKERGGEDVELMPTEEVIRRLLDLRGKMASERL